MEESTKNSLVVKIRVKNGGAGGTKPACGQSGINFPFISEADLFRLTLEIYSEDASSWAWHLRLSLKSVVRNKYFRAQLSDAF